MQDFSQRGEQAAILEAVKAVPLDGPPKFLDVGAADGVTLSNTHALFLLGWSGVVVDASPYAIAALVENYRQHAGQRIEIVDMAVGDPGLRRFHLTRDMVSTLNPANHDLWKDAAAFTPTNKVVVAPRTAWGLLGALGPFLVVSIDVEGGSREMFEAMPPSELGAEVVIVEHDGKIEEVAAEGRRRGFWCALTTAENCVLRRNP